jgi:hypothetical protein
MANSVNQRASKGNKNERASKCSSNKVELVDEFDRLRPLERDDSKPVSNIPHEDVTLPDLDIREVTTDD